ncbi:MAG TPA: SRPBCC domain-containing protein [Acidothermaceae bacterium]|nr:SRPBCC domain-containing protein [Acidothermaceae bacterium]
MTEAVELERFFPHPPADVWRALTDAELLGQWLMPNDIVPVVGHSFTFTTKPMAEFDGVVHCTVLEVDVEHRLVFAWRSNSGLDTTVTWTLRAEANGTLLRLVHHGFDTADPLQRIAFDAMGGGWRGHIADRLAATLDRRFGVVLDAPPDGTGTLPTG